MSVSDDLVPILKKLRLSGVLQTLDLRTNEAVDASLSHSEFLFRLCSDEVERRESKQLDLRMRRASFGGVKRIAVFAERLVPAIRSDDPITRLQGCIVALRPQTGEVIALVGGRDYRISQFDRCTQARRPTGSVFKPFVFIAALEPRGLRR